MYENSSELARATPHVRLSRPTPPDNTEWFSYDEQRMVEPAKVVLCFDCQQPIPAGKGVQVKRLLRTGNDTDNYGSVPCDSLVHAECNLDPYAAFCDGRYRIGNVVMGQDVRLDP
jgi:hypothetical protein